ncbi:MULTISPECIES: hypothetical protein [unclassified Pseudomonas]|uniref:hypothetical protein n=1 Tax=unclassified Pseudomonas TaxID=196821 RepID=UPI000DAE64DB|nr:MULTISPECIES: hypothetical protein [unclassified Pseudomonas]MBD9655659.1 hypothetical protein [Pseudomonas sp. PDM12]PZW47426.1 hypothetical protein F469_01294 [Pseudomonas sp. URMO17WK12:I2]
MRFLRPVLLLSLAFLVVGCTARQPLPETPKRAALIESVLDKSSMVTTVADSDRGRKTDAQMREEARNAADRLKAKARTDLPEDYWSTYEEGSYQFSLDVNSIEQRSLEAYKARYRQGLVTASDEELEQLVRSESMEGTPTFKKLFNGGDTRLTLFYFQQDNRFSAQALDDYLKRLDALDKRYGVCVARERCWK